MHRRRRGAVLVLVILVIIFALMFLAALVIDFAAHRVEYQIVASQADSAALEQAIATGEDSEETIDSSVPVLFGRMFTDDEEIGLRVTSGAEMRPAKSVGESFVHLVGDEPVKMAGLTNAQIDISDWNADNFGAIATFDPSLLRSVSVGQAPFSTEGGPYDLPDTLVDYIVITKSDWEFAPAIVGFGAISVTESNGQKIVSRVADPPIENVTNTFLPSPFADDTPEFLESVLQQNQEVLQNGLVAPVLLPIR